MSCGPFVDPISPWHAPARHGPQPPTPSFAQDSALWVRCTECMLGSRAGAIRGNDCTTTGKGVQAWGRFVAPGARNPMDMEHRDAACARRPALFVISCCSIRHRREQPARKKRGSAWRPSLKVRRPAHALGPVCAQVHAQQAVGSRSIGETPIQINLLACAGTA